MIVYLSELVKKKFFGIENQAKAQIKSRHVKKNLKIFSWKTFKKIFLS